MRHYARKRYVLYTTPRRPGNRDCGACIQDQLILHRLLYKLFHIEEAMEQNAREIKTQSKALSGLREEQRVHDVALEEARADQAKARLNVMQKEKKIKKAEKDLDGKVGDVPGYSC